jgi:tetratricopeptide (TPR) repeat protein
MSSTRSPRFDPDELARTDDELDFALRSLDDLEAEREQRQISSRRYEELRASYVTQAAELVRQRDRMTRRRPMAPPRGRRSRLAIGAAVAAVLILPVSMVAAGSSNRAPGQTITGNTSATSGRPAPTIQTDPKAQAGSTAQPDPKAEVDRHPEDPRAHDAYAAELMQQGNLNGAIQQFTAATQLDPRDAEALTYSAWIAFLGGFPDKALPRLAAAESVDPTYPDPHAFRGIVLLRGKNDRSGASQELRRYLSLDPGGPMASQVQAVLDEIARGPVSK